MIIWSILGYPNGTMPVTTVTKEEETFVGDEKSKKLVEQCRNIKKSLGSYDRILTPQDYAQRKNMRRSIIYKKGLKAGHIISANDLGFKRPGTGLEPEKLRSVIGQTLLSNIEGDTLVKRSDWTN